MVSSIVTILIATLAVNAQSQSSVTTTASAVAITTKTTTAVVSVVAASTTITTTIATVSSPVQTNAPTSGSITSNTGFTQPGLPADPDGQYCGGDIWHNPNQDGCFPLDGNPRPGQQVYIKDELNFCINLPDPDSIFLQNVFYKQGKLPSVVEAEGFVRAFCLGDYIPPAAKKMPEYGIKSAHVEKYQNYIQVWGTLDCEGLNINCTSSSPGVYDDAGQYDNVPFESCGKEPYSGVDTSPQGNPGSKSYIEQAGNGIFCMRVCDTELGSDCVVTTDRAGCEATLGVHFSDGFTFADKTTGEVVTATTNLPKQRPSPTFASSTTAAATGAGATGSTKSAASLTSFSNGLISLLSCFVFLMN
ncbi:UNVERIFIED_CONTAM: hypothetical protein HDU68_009856 [Siphonaria sp. JEL0065]|nr:hypothetical protein HDU68_009856 [Siphonaria sp. JEL0065]